MSEQELFEQIGKMHVERNDVQRKLVCVDDKLRDMKYACQRAIAAIDSAANWQESGEGLTIFGNSRGI